MQKIVIALLLLTSLLLAREEAPQWLSVDPDKKAQYFRGVSTWYVANDAVTAPYAQREALKDGYSKVSDYFGLNIKSSVELSGYSDADSGDTQLKTHITTKTNQLIFDLKPIKSYREYTEDKKNFRVHILLRLDSITEHKIKAEMQKDREAYEKTKEKIIKLINQREYFQAQNLLESAKGMRSAYMDDTLTQIEKRLLQLKDGALRATLEINKRNYLPNENINVEVSLNKRGYLYLFYDTGSDVEMLFPNKFQRDNYLKKEEMIYFPNDAINQLIAYEESEGLHTAIIALASKEHLALKRYKSDTIDGVYIFDKDGVYQDVIKRCIKEAKCSETRRDFTISSTTSHHNIELEFQTTSKLKNRITQYLMHQGVVSKRGRDKIVFVINKEMHYSSLLGMNIVKYRIKALYFKDNQKLKKEVRECSQEEIFSEIESLINSKETF